MLNLKWIPLLQVTWQLPELSLSSSVIEACLSIETLTSIHNRKGWVWRWHDPEFPRQFASRVRISGSFKWHDDVIKWKYFPRYWPFVWGIHRSQVNSPHKGQCRGAWMFSLICTWINDWVNNSEACDLRRHRAHYDVIVTYHGWPNFVSPWISRHCLWLI